MVVSEIGVFRCIEIIASLELRLISKGLEEWNILLEKKLFLRSDVNQK